MLAAVSGCGALTVASSIVFSFHMGGCQMNVTGGGINMGMPQQGLHHGQINASFRQSGAERVAQSMRITGDDSGDDAVVTKDGAQARRGEWHATSGALRHDEQRPAGGLGSFGEQICLDDTGDVTVEGNTAFLGSFARDEQPPTAVSTSLTCKARTSHDRSPQNSIRPATARSRQVRKLFNRSVVS